MPGKRVVIAGGSGLVGSGIARVLRNSGFEVAVLSRGAGSDKSHIHWDGRAGGAWVNALEGSAALINLSGKNINCRPSVLNRRHILESRIQPTSALLDAISGCSNPPSVFIQASAVGLYGNTDQSCDETAAAGSGYLADICREWEACFHSVSLPRTRKITARFGIVLSRAGGAFPVLHRLASYFLGGSAGAGSQYISWIHADDLNRVMLSMLADETMEGVYNVTAPDPVTNAEFMKTLRAALHRPWSPPVPSLCIKLGAFILGSNPDLALGGQRAVPRRLTDKGFQFDYDKTEKAINQLCTGAANE